MIDNKIQELVEKITKANDFYRKGEDPNSDNQKSLIISDKEYDTLLEQLEVLDPNNELLTSVGIEIDNSDSRKELLPIDMASMNKVKTLEEIKKWIKSKGIPEDTLYVLTPKFDGASLCIDEWNENAWTRGNGIYGQRSDGHIQLMNRNKIEVSPEFYTFGEVIMSRKTFQEKYADEYANPRNLVAGQLNHKTPNEILKDCDYISFGCVGDNKNHDKLEQITLLNESQKNPIKYKLCTIEHITEDFLLNLFTEWNKEYEIDGIIIEVNDRSLRDSLGRETSSNNPCYARAYKGDFEEVKPSPILELEYEISKNGLAKPVAIIEPIVLDGATVKRVTLNNAKFVKDLDLGVGSIIEVKRSGMVIPKLVSVVKATGFKFPIIDGCELIWNENEVELVTLNVTEEQRVKQLISFFEILEVENMGEGIVKQFFENGYDTPLKVLSMKKEDMIVLEKFGERKANKIIQSINERRNVTLSKLQHASGLFNNLGSKKLLLLEDLYSTDLTEESLIEEIKNRDGFSDISANNYTESIEEYKEFEKTLSNLLEISLSESKEVNSNDLEGMSFVFSGVRRKDLNEIIESKGGKIASGVSSKTTHLVMKSKGTGSSKEKKAESLGQTILTVEELEELIS